MSLKYRRDVSFSLATFFLRVVGFWLASSRLEEWFGNATVMYSIITIIFSMWVQMRGLYFSWGDFSICTFIACNSLGLIMDLLKIFVVFIHKKKFLGLIIYMKKNFWHLDYDQYENSIIADAKQMCVYFVCVFSFFSQSTVFSYMLMPMISNIGKNESDRMLIFNMWLDLPLSMSPYFEIIYVIQALCLYQVGICYLCVDNMFCIMCLHLASQFRILQYRLANLSSVEDKEGVDNEENMDSSNRCYIILKNCIRQHQALIQFSITLEEIFTIITLGQVLIFSTLICFVGYQVLLVNLTFSWRISFLCFLITNMSQLWMFTYSCDCMTRESVNVASAVYSIPWTRMPMDKFGKMIRKDLQFVVVRSRRACCLTGCGFFDISLETYTKVIFNDIIKKVNPFFRVSFSIKLR
ncbi:odorant receptor 47a-like isoform X1 [Apis dorsata]|uniref:odorant receptor 47a-like isoform X1 n=1 Tax=Apis dorsata TaxID=7462 RepID=UPI001293FA42|nr:odorant receptor 47a-like isoform X1 [Apis dorsata]